MVPVRPDVIAAGIDVCSADASAPGIGIVEIVLRDEVHMVPHCMKKGEGRNALGTGIMHAEMTLVRRKTDLVPRQVCVHGNANRQTVELRYNLLVYCLEFCIVPNIQLHDEHSVDACQITIDAAAQSGDLHAAEIPLAQRHALPSLAPAPGV